MKCFRACCFLCYTRAWSPRCCQTAWDPRSVPQVYGPTPELGIDECLRVLTEDFRVVIAIRRDLRFFSGTGNHTRCLIHNSGYIGPCCSCLQAASLNEGLTGGMSGCQRLWSGCFWFNGRLEGSTDTTGVGVLGGICAVFQPYS